MSKYKGKVLGVDAYVWLHRGAYGCAEALALGRPTTKYVEYAMAHIHMLRHHGITPYVVFDGDRLPAKAKTEEDRLRRREESLALARQFAALGKMRDAHEQYARCVDVTPAMAFQLIKRLREAKIDYIVAPYEADAQLAYLERRGVIHGIVTEDSDLLVFGCRTVLYKMDKDGNCVELLHERRAKCKSLPMHTFNEAMFRQMAILSGCDYLPSIPKMGLKTAHSMLRRCSTVSRVITLALSQGMQVPNGYREAFERAERTFVYQHVFDRTKDGEIRMTTLTKQSREDGANNGDDDCIGPQMTPEEVHGIASGEIDPITRKPIEDLTQASTSAKAAATAPPSKSFYAQARPKWIRDGSKKVTHHQIHGQGKLEKFFTKQQTVAMGTSQSASKNSQHGMRQPLAARTNRMDIVAEALAEEKGERDYKRARVEPQADKAAEPPKGKSKYFAEQAPASSSPSKLYDGNADLATFSTPTQRSRQRRTSNPSSDGGMISSPGSASVDRMAKIVDTPLLFDENVVPSSPCTSPSLGVQARTAATAKHIVDHPHVESDMKDDLFSQFRFSGNERFQTPMAAFSRSVVSARQHGGSARATVKTTGGSSSTGNRKRSLAVDWENDPFDEDVRPLETPTNAASQHTLQNTLRDLQRSPVYPTTVKRSASGRRLILLDGESR